MMASSAPETSEASRAFASSACLRSVMSSATPSTDRAWPCGPRRTRPRRWTHRTSPLGRTMRNSCSKKSCWSLQRRHVALPELGAVVGMHEAQHLVGIAGELLVRASEQPVHGVGPGHPVAGDVALPDAEARGGKRQRQAFERQAQLFLGRIAILHVACVPCCMRGLPSEPDDGENVCRPMRQQLGSRVAGRMPGRGPLKLSLCRRCTTKSKRRARSGR